jgi:predicted aconitase with swiveling domain
MYSFCCEGKVVIISCVKRIQGVGLVPGLAEGEAIVARTRISFWGGFDPKNGVILQEGPLYQKEVAGKFLVFISTKGSSGTSGMLSLAKKGNNHPAAFVNQEVDEMAVLGCMVNEIPMVGNLLEDPFEFIRTGDYLKVNGSEGFIEIFRKNRYADQC